MEKLRSNRRYGRLMWWVDLALDILAWFGLAVLLDILLTPPGDHPLDRTCPAMARWGHECIYGAKHHGAHHCECGKEWPR